MHFDSGKLIPILLIDCLLFQSSTRVHIPLQNSQIVSLKYSLQFFVEGSVSDVPHAPLDVLEHIVHAGLGVVQPPPAVGELAGVEVDVVDFRRSWEVGDVEVVDFVVAVGLFACEHQVTFD